MRRCSSDIYGGHNIHAWPKLVILVFSRIKDNFYRNALNDFYVITRCIFRREQAEERTGGSGNAVYMTLKCLPARIHMDVGFLANFHLPQLRLFEISGDPDFIQG